MDWPKDPIWATTYYTVGLIRGGVAPNVIPPDADAEVMFRTVGDASDVRRLLDARFAGRLGLEDVLDVPPVRLRAVPGFDPAVFSFTTDIPFLDRWGEPLLVGPGSVTLAHTADEHVEIADLEQAVDIYAQLATSLIAQIGLTSDGRWTSRRTFGPSKRYGGGVEAAENAGDPEYCAGLLADDAVLMVPDFPVQNGRDACVGFLRDLLPGSDRGLRTAHHLLGFGGPRSRRHRVRSR